jgi:predicted RNA-binding protein with EMAP domain
MPNGELKILVEDMKEMKEDITDLKYTLLNPENGVIVKTNKNSAFREKMEAGDKDFTTKMADVEDLKRWKEGVTKALWILFAGLAAVIIRLLTEVLQ